MRILQSSFVSHKVDKGLTINSLKFLSQPTSPEGKFLSQPTSPEVLPQPFYGAILWGMAPSCGHTQTMCQSTIPAWLPSKRSTRALFKCSQRMWRSGYFYFIDFFLFLTQKQDAETGVIPASQFCWLPQKGHKNIIALLLQITTVKIQIT